MNFQFTLEAETGSIVLESDIGETNYMINESFTMATQQPVDTGKAFEEKAGTTTSSTADDILAYDLPSDDLTKQDISALDSELTDPRFNSGYWKDQINLMKEIGKKAEQQSLAKYGLDFVTETYLPEKLQQLGL